jgi:glyoxylase-like metal-dependent hydrolase (beta-lactamase superfamily II)
MSTPSPQTDSLASAALRYPFEVIPEPGDAIEVAHGVLWLRMPLGMALTHINVWAIRDGEGWTIVDTGLKNDGTVAAWPRVLADRLEGRPVKRVVVTHMHPDHVGMAGWLTEKFGCSLAMTRDEYLTSRVFVNETNATLEEEIAFYRRAGWDDAALAAYRADAGDFATMLHPLPQRFERLRDKQTLRIGEHDWQVITGYGHSPEHACLYCPALRIFISGDQVLPKITSNVSVHPMEPLEDPLLAWMESIAKIRALVPDDVLVLPSHNEPFQGLHARLARLSQGHERALERLLEALDEPRRAVDVFAALFARPITNDGMLLLFATGESIAHLNHLIARGEAVATLDENGVAWYARNKTNV